MRARATAAGSDAATEENPVFSMLYAFALTAPEVSGINRTNHELSLLPGWPWAHPHDRPRRELCAAEAATGLTPGGGDALGLGISAIDGVLGGGLSCGALHEIAAAHETETAAATGFALALAARQALPSCESAARTGASAVSTRIPGRY